MRTLLFAMLCMFISCTALADSQRSSALVDFLKSPQLTIQYVTDGTQRVPGSVSITPSIKTTGNRTVTLIKDGAKTFVGIELDENGKHWITCCLRDGEWQYSYHIYNGMYYDRWTEDSRLVGSVYAGSKENTIKRCELILANDVFSDFWATFLQYIGVNADYGDFKSPAVPIKLNGSYFTSGQDTINDVTYDFDEYRDENVSGLTANNRYYYKDGKLVQFISLGKCIVIEPELYKSLFFRPGLPKIVSFEATDQAKAVRIKYLSNAVDPTSMQFPSQVRFIDRTAAMEKVKPETLAEAREYEIEGKRRLDIRRKKLFNAIKQLYEMNH